MLRVGIVGIGFMGWIHWLAYQKVAGVTVAAIATNQPAKRQGDWTSIQGNFGPPGEKVDLSAVASYASLDEMLTDESLDLIDICLPPSLHVEAIEKAANAGKHVFCEKPLALNLSDCDRAIEACRQNRRLLLVGHIVPYFAEYLYARQQIEAGEFGRVLGGSFKRVIADPTWNPHFYDPAVTGGPLFDLHVHDAHLIRMLFGMPTSVHCCGRKRRSVVEYCHSIFHFADSSLVVASTMGAIDQPGRPFQQGFEIQLERASIQFEYSGFVEPHQPELSPLKILTNDGQLIYPKTGDGDLVLAFEREVEEVVRCATSNRPSVVLSGELARDAIEMCEMQTREIFSN